MLLNIKNKFWGMFLILALASCGGSSTGEADPDPITPENVFDRTDIEGDLQLLLPFAENESFTVTQGYDGAFSHNDDCLNNSLDFDLPEGTPILSVAAGRVMAVKEDSNQGGTTDDFLDDVNFIYIDHGYGLMGVYLHLCENCAAVAPGDVVAQGAVIGESGNTGFSSGAHLHFEMDSWETGCSIAYGFYDVPDDEGLALEGESYTSVNTGNSAVAYVESEIPAATFDFNGVVLDAGFSWRLTRGETLTLTGTVTNGKTNVAVFLIEDGMWVDGATAIVANDDSFEIAYTIDTTIAAGSYTIALTTSDSDFFETESSRYVLIE